MHFDFLTNKIDPQLKAFLEKNNANLYEVPSLKNPFGQYKAIKALIQQNKYDTAYFNISTSICFLGPKAAKKCGIPKIIIHSHSSGYDCMNDKKRIVMTKLNNLCRNFIYKYGTDFYACSKIAGLWMFPKRIVSSNKFRVINNAVDVDKFAFSPTKREDMRRELNLSDKLVVGHIGNFVYQKNHGFLIDTFNELHKIDPNACLLLLGDGVLFESIKQKVDELGLSENVIFTGRVSNANDYLQAMDIFVLPSNFEGLGIVAVEAQASGLKCVFSDRVPEEAILTENCVSLKINGVNDAKIWAEKIYNTDFTGRTDQTDIIIAKGYSLKNQNLNMLV